jgi:hypothetical protein
LKLEIKDNCQNLTEIIYVDGVRVKNKEFIFGDLNGTDEMKYKITFKAKKYYFEYEK